MSTAPVLAATGSYIGLDLSSRHPVTKNDDDTHRTTYQYPGDIACILIMISTFVLSILAILLNLGVVSFYRKQIKNLVPFIYSILAGSDFCTGMCTGLHSVVFLVLLIVKEEDSWFLFWLAFLTYFTTIITFRLSALVSLTFSVIRTINILSPFKRIKKRTVCIAIAIYMAILIALSLGEIGIFMTTSVDLYEGQNAGGSREHMLWDKFFRPGSLNNLFLSLFYRLNKDEQKTATGLKHFCAISAVSTLPILLPATLALVATAVQIFVLLAPQNLNTGQQGTESTKKEVSITIAIISSLFFICSIFTISLPLTACVQELESMDQAEKELLLYLTMYIPMFLNAALNPLILILRGEQLNEYVRNKMGIRRRGGLEGVECSLGNLGNGLGGGKARPERYSIDTINTQASVNLA